MKNKTAGKQHCSSSREKTIAALFVVCFILIHSAKTLSLPIMGPETKHRIKMLINDGAELAPLPGGWNVAEWRYTDFDIFIRVEKAPGGKTVFRLACASLPSASRFIGGSRNFRMELISFSGVNEEEAVQAGHALLRRIQRNDEPLFFDHPDMQKREGTYERFFRAYLFLPLLIAGLAAVPALFAAGLPLIRQYLLPCGKTAAALLAFLAILGGAIRFSAGPDALVHNNGHGVRELRAILYPESREQKEILYGVAYLTLMRNLAGAAGGDDNAVFSVNKIAGTLVIVAMYMLARALFLSEAAALSAALAVCFSPGLVWLSGSESPVTMHLFFSLAGLAFAGVSARHRNKPLLWLSCVFICLGSTMRLLTLTAAPVAVLIFICFSRRPADSAAGKKDNFRNHSLLCLGVIFMWVLFHCLSLDPDNVGNGIARISFPLYFHNMLAYNILFDPTLTPACLPYFAAAGFIIALWKRPRAAVMAAVVFVLIVPVSFTAVGERTNFLYYQFQTHWIYFLFAGAIVDYMWKSGFPRGKIAALCVPAAIALFSISGLKFLHAGNEEIAEYHFIKKAASRMEPGALIELPARPRPGGRMNTEFPDYLGKYSLERTEAEGGGNPTVYIGLDCYRYENKAEMNRESHPGGLRRECASICGGRRPFALMEKTLEVRKPDEIFHRRYFLLGSRRPVIGFYKCRDAAQ